MSHTKEPWVVCRCSPSAFNVYHDEETVIGDEGLYSEVNQNAEGDAERIVACVNACAGIPSEQLNRVISAHAAEVERLTGERDKLQKHVEDVEKIAFARESAFVAERDAATARAERAESCLRSIKAITDSSRIDMTRPTRALTRIEELADAVLSSPPADASKIGGEREHPYGYCPVCGAPGMLRERRPNGNDICENVHFYPSKDAVMEQKP